MSTMYKKSLRPLLAHWLYMKAEKCVLYKKELSFPGYRIIVAPNSLQSCGRPSFRRWGPLSSWPRAITLSLTVRLNTRSRNFFGLTAAIGSSTGQTSWLRQSMSRTRCTTSPLTQCPLSVCLGISHHFILGKEHTQTSDEQWVYLVDRQIGIRKRHLLIR